MGISNLLQKATLTVALALLSLAAAAQVQLKGTVYDRSARIGMPGVSVRSTSGAGTVTDSMGRYSIRLARADSISFSYQGKATQKFPVTDIDTYHPFDIKLHVDVQVLPTVEVSAKRPYSYQLDSLENRNEYRKVFDYNPQFLSGGSSNGFGVGVNLDMLLSGKKIRRMEHFRQLLERQERDRYVSHRFNKELVKKITGLEAPALDTFMVYYRPSYEMLWSFENEYEYYKYIRDWGEYFAEEWKRVHPARDSFSTPE